MTLMRQGSLATGAVQAELNLLTSVDRIPGALAQLHDRHGGSVTIILRLPET